LLKIFSTAMWEVGWQYHVVIWTRHFLWLQERGAESLLVWLHIGRNLDSCSLGLGLNLSLSLNFWQWLGLEHLSLGDSLSVHLILLLMSSHKLMVNQLQKQPQRELQRPSSPHLFRQGKFHFHHQLFWSYFAMHFSQPLHRQLVTPPICRFRDLSTATCIVQTTYSNMHDQRNFTAVIWELRQVFWNGPIVKCNSKSATLHWQKISARSGTISNGQKCLLQSQIPLSSQNNSAHKTKEAPDISSANVRGRKSKLLGGSTATFPHC
jgi:hypothetical protein